MSCKTYTFDVFGVTYRSTQFAAVRALELVSAEEVSPLEVLEKSEVLVGDVWVALNTREAVNLYVRDRVGMQPATLVLRGVLKLIGEHSCGVVKGWKGVSVPSRFTSEGQGLTTRQSSHVDPVIAALIADDKASLRELEEYYSLEDALKMLDVMTAKGVNEALANESAAKSRRK